MRRPSPPLVRLCARRPPTGGAASPSPRPSAPPAVGPTLSTPPPRPSATSPIMSGRISYSATPPAAPAISPPPSAPTAPPCVANRAILAFAPNWPVSVRPPLAPADCRTSPKTRSSSTIRSSSKTRSSPHFAMSTHPRFPVGFPSPAARHVRGRTPRFHPTSGNLAAPPTALPSTTASSATRPPIIGLPTSAPSAIRPSTTPPAIGLRSTASSAAVLLEPVLRPTTSTARPRRATASPMAGSLAAELLLFVELRHSVDLPVTTARQTADELRPAVGPQSTAACPSTTLAATDPRESIVRQPIGLQVEIDSPGPAAPTVSVGRREPVGRRWRRSWLGVPSVSCPSPW